MLPAFFFKTCGTNRRRNFLGIVKCIERFRRDPGGMGAQIGKMNKPVLLFTSTEPFKQGIGQKYAVAMLPSIRRGCGGMDLFSSFRKENSLPVQISRIPFFFQPTDPCFVLIIDLQSRSHSRKHVLIGFQIRIVGMQSPGIHRGVRITKEGRIKSSLTTF